MQGQDTDRVRGAGGEWVVTCAWCGGQFHATREDASFCSARCRMQNSRDTGNKKRWCERTIQTGNMIDRYVQSRDRLSDPDVYQAILNLKNSLEWTLSRFDRMR